MALIESMRKKVCMHSDVYFRTNKQTGKTTTGKLCNPSDVEPSAAQIAAKARFAKVVAAVRTVLSDPTEKAKLKAELAERLERYVACAEGSMKGLNTLLYGWKKKRKYGKTYCQVLTNRDWRSEGADS